jgi:hypothetical protein
MLANLLMHNTCLEKRASTPRQKHAKRKRREREAEAIGAKPEVARSNEQERWKERSREKSRGLAISRQPERKVKLQAVKRGTKPRIV